ncbi:MAG: hypothetical protein KBH78_12305 [Candidatus Hydrogenedentes bacterium]|nr:hypothetical protein [Candidatus Hydrogenedentota bacterium]
MDISSLCNTWWNRVTTSARSEQQGFVRRLLGLLDWDMPMPFTPPPAAEEMGAITYLLRSNGRSTVAACFLPPGLLESPSAVIARGLDCCPAVRVLLDDLRSPAIHYLFISDLGRAYLYDAHTEELLEWSDDAGSFEARFQPLLKRGRVIHGALEELRRPSRNASAKQLREWALAWADRLESSYRVPSDQAGGLFDRLCVLYATREYHMFRRTRQRLLSRFDELVREAQNGPDRSGIGRDLVRLFHDMWLDWRVGLFAPCAPLDNALEEDALARAWLREALLHGRHKFTTATLLESFNYGDPAEKMRVRMVPEENPDREAYLYGHGLDNVDAARVVVDVAEEGYRAVLFWFDRVVALYDRLTAEFDRRAARSTDTGSEADLFAWSEANAGRPSACVDSLAHACGRGFGVLWSTPRQFRIARLLLTMHLIHRYAERNEPVERLPEFETLMERRPAVLSPDRVLTPRRRVSSDVDSL